MNLGFQTLNEGLKKCDFMLPSWGPLPGGPGGPWTPQNKTGGPVIGLDPPDCF